MKTKYPIGTRFTPRGGKKPRPEETVEDMEKLRNAYHSLDERIVSLEVENANMRDHLESLGELDKLVEDGSVSEDKKSKPEAK